MTIQTAIQTIMDGMVASIMDVGDKPRGGNSPEPPTTVEAAKIHLMATSFCYYKLSQLLQLAKGEITDVTAGW